MSKTLVGNIADDVLAFTVGKDCELDAVLVEADCIGTAAHVTMLASLAAESPLLSTAEKDRVVAALLDIMRTARKGKFRIRLADQDVHLAVERELTRKLGGTGRKIHTGRSRNDQVAVDLRLYAKGQLSDLMAETGALATALLTFARRHKMAPMVGRTHQQPAMPSSVGVWASSYAEGLLDDMILVRAAYDVNDRCPLGSAASYGVPLPIDRKQTAALLGFAAPIHNVLHASNARGKCEGAILQALAQEMVTLSRLARDLIMYSMPEFAYFSLPVEYCTGSSIMPQKKNPDVLELVRAKCIRVVSDASATLGIVAGIPGGYNRDLQEVKEPFLNGLQTTRRCLQIMTAMIDGLSVDQEALLKGFSADVYAADRALQLVAEGQSFRDAYEYVRTHLDELQEMDPHEAVARKNHLGAPGGLDLDALQLRARDISSFARAEKRRYSARISKLLGVSYPGLDDG